MLMTMFRKEVFASRHSTANVNKRRLSTTWSTCLKTIRAQFSAKVSQIIITPCFRLTMVWYGEVWQWCQVGVQHQWRHQQGCWRHSTDDCQLLVVINLVDSLKISSKATIKKFQSHAPDQQIGKTTNGQSTSKGSLSTVMTDHFRWIL